ncbi:MAG: DNA repair exonuclease SbcCD ATPase subunit [Candidatus Woesearchaeota archaeon]|jgi:DNA repair exonuclease SbcCD ATPase subunit
MNNALFSKVSPVMAKKFFTHLHNMNSSVVTDYTQERAEQIKSELKEKAEYLQKQVRLLEREHELKTKVHNPKEDKLNHLQARYEQMHHDKKITSSQLKEYIQRIEQLRKKLY